MSMNNDPVKRSSAYGKGMDVASVLGLRWVSVRGPRGYLGRYRRCGSRVGSGWDGVQLVSLVSVVFGKGGGSSTTVLLYVPCHPGFAVSFRVECCTHTCLCLARNKHPNPLPPHPSSTLLTRILVFLTSTSLFCTVAPHSAHRTEHASPRPFRSAGL